MRVPARYSTPLPPPIVSLLTGISPQTIVRDPFPHIVAGDVVGEAMCDELTQAFPALGSFTRGAARRQNQKIVRRSTDLLSDPGLSPLWRTVIEEHLQHGMFQEWMTLFGHDLTKEHPSIAGGLPEAELARVGQRGVGDEFSHDVFLDAALVAHTPVTEGTCAERGPHVKEPDKPFLGFLFLRPPQDVAEGGELCLYAAKEGAQLSFAGRNQADAAELELVRSVPYRRNVLVLLLNTARTITTHAPRGVSPFPMQYFHFLVQLPRPMFALPPQGPGS